MKVYNGMSGKELRDWRKANRLRAIEEMEKEAALHPPVQLTPEEEKAAKDYFRLLIKESLSVVCLLIVFAVPASIDL